MGSLVSIVEIDEAPDTTDQGWSGRSARLEPPAGFHEMPVVVARGDSRRRSRKEALFGVAGLDEDLAGSEVEVVVQQGKGPDGY